MRKARELLAFLAVQQPDGATGETISEALWPEADPGRAAGQRNLALRKAREMLRTAAGLTEPRWILNASGRYRLDPALIGTDLEATAVKDGPSVGAERLAYLAEEVNDPPRDLCRRWRGRAAPAIRT